MLLLSQCPAPSLFTNEYFKMMYFMCRGVWLHVCMCTTCMSSSYSIQKRVWDPMNLGLDDWEPPCGCQDTGPLRKQQVLSTTGPSLQPLLSFQESGSLCARLAPTHGDPYPPECWDLHAALSQLSSLCCSSLLCGTKAQTQILSMPGRHSVTKPHPQPRSFTSREFSPYFTCSL